MANNPDYLFGFEIIQKLYDNQVRKKEDIIILFVHWYLVKSGFRCIGLGDSKAFNSLDKGSELLPEKWNTNPNYALRYIYQGKLHILNGIRSDEDILLNLLRVADHHVTNAQFPIGHIVQGLHGDLQHIIPGYNMVIDTLHSSLLDQMLSDTIANASTQTRGTFDDESERSRHTDDDPLAVGRDRTPSPGSSWVNTANVGRGDLDPLGRGGGGMFFDPFSPGRPLRPPHTPGVGVPGRLPPGAIPPGARFYPFGPPDPTPRYPRRFDDPDDFSII